MPANSPSGLGPWCLGVRVVVRRVLPGLTGPTGGPAMTDVLGVLEEWGRTTLTVRTEDGATVVVDRADVVAGKPVPPRPSTRLRVPVTDAELRAMDSWPPLESDRVGDWVLRASAGFSTRGNSALLVGEPGLPWPEAVQRLTGFYAVRGLPVWVQVMSGSPEVERLEAAGWGSLPTNDAEVAFQLGAVAQARRNARRLVAPGAPTVVLEDSVTDSWLADDRRARAHREAAVGILEGPAEVVFAAVRSPEGAVVAKGRAALSERVDVWVGISDLWVAPEQRRRGHAAAVVEALLGWSAERGATTAYLQTRMDNPSALALYERLGFTTHHRYRYLEPPP